MKYRQELTPTPEAVRVTDVFLQMKADIMTILHSAHQQSTTAPQEKNLKETDQAGATRMFTLVNFIFSGPKGPCQVSATIEKTGLDPSTDTDGIINNELYFTLTNFTLQYDDNVLISLGQGPPSKNTSPSPVVDVSGAKPVYEYFPQEASGGPSNIFLAHQQLRQIGSDYAGIEN